MMLLRHDLSNNDDMSIYHVFKVVLDSGFGLRILPILFIMTCKA